MLTLQRVLYLLNHFTYPVDLPLVPFPFPSEEAELPLACLRHPGIGADDSLTLGPQQVNLLSLQAQLGPHSLFLLGMLLNARVGRGTRFTLEATL